jgi:hypothetical protein
MIVRQKKSGVEEKMKIKKNTKVKKYVRKD